MLSLFDIPYKLVRAKKYNKSKFKENTLKTKLVRRVNRRIILAGVLKAGAVALLGWNIRKLQIEDSEDYKLLADANRVNLRLIPPQEGSFLIDLVLQ